MVRVRRTQESPITRPGGPVWGKGLKSPLSPSPRALPGKYFVESILRHDSTSGVSGLDVTSIDSRSQRGVSPNASGAGREGGRTRTASRRGTLPSVDRGREGQTGRQPGRTGTQESLPRTGQPRLPTRTFESRTDSGVTVPGRDQDEQQDNENGRVRTHTGKTGTGVDVECASRSPRR